MNCLMFEGLNKEFDLQVKQVLMIQTGAESEFRERINGGKFTCLSPGKEVGERGAME